MTAPTDLAHGTQTAVINTEHTLNAAITDPGVVQLNLDVSNMAGGGTPDILEIRVYGKTLAGDTKSLLDIWTLVGVQTQNIFYSPIYAFVNYLEFTVKQVAGTGRDYKWTQVKLS